jgi:hypothetical protein
MKLGYKTAQIELVSKDSTRGSNCIQGPAEQPQERDRSHMTIRQSIVAIVLALNFAGFLVVRPLIGNGVIGGMMGWKLYAVLFVVTSLVGLLSVSRGNGRGA